MSIYEVKDSIGKPVEFGYDSITNTIWVNRKDVDIVYTIDQGAHNNVLYQKEVIVDKS